MTHPPYASGPADPARPTQPPGPPPGPAAQPGGPAPLSFQYRPHDPRATFAAGQPAGSVLPPPPTFAQRWGFTGKDDRPRQVTVMLQSLWIALAADVLGIVLGLAAGSTAVLVLGLVFGLLAAAANLILIWGFARERLGRLGFGDPHHPVYIGLGLIGLNALTGFLSVWKFVPALAQLAAAVLVLILLFTRPVRAWLRDRPGNQPRKDEEPRPLPGEDYLAGRPSPSQNPWPASPVAPPGPHGRPPAPPQGWQQPGR
jgi:hypothetical protein